MNRAGIDPASRTETGGRVHIDIVEEGRCEQRRGEKRSFEDGADGGGVGGDDGAVVGGRLVAVVAVVAAVGAVGGRGGGKCFVPLGGGWCYRVHHGDCGGGSGRGGGGGVFGVGRGTLEFVEFLEQAFGGRG